MRWFKLRYVLAPWAAQLFAGALSDVVNLENLAGLLATQFALNRDVPEVAGSWSIGDDVFHVT
jgi:hypothetical protein